MSAVTGATFLFSAVVIGAIGVLIREFQMMELIAGYDPERVTDDEGLATFVGTQILLIAGLTVAVAGLELAGPVADLTQVYVLYTVAVVALTGYIVYGAQRYTES
jgi:hypothetical protein